MNLYQPTEIITDTQTELKLLIRDNISTEPIEFKKKADKLITDAVKDIEYKGIKNSELFKLTVYATLTAFALTRFAKLKDVVGDVKLSDVYSVGRVKGLPPYANQAKYIRSVKEAFTSLIESDAKYSPNVSIRNLSEQIVRQADFDNKLSGLQKKSNLVIMSVHEDCAPDHAKWQGKVYSLDGSTGRTEDGRNYVPIETVTGSQPKGIRPVGKYNCRHTFSEYKSFIKPEPISVATRKKEYEITKTQRQLERETRKARENYLMYKDIDKTKASQYRQKSIELKNAYENYSKANDRAFYRTRLQVI